MAPAPPDVVSRKRDAMQVEWKPPRKDGGSEVTGYIVEIKERNSVLWKALTRTHSTGKRLGGKTCIALVKLRKLIKSFYNRFQSNWIERRIGVPIPCLCY